jgi:pilus assembly protein Flp/PilA
MRTIVRAKEIALRLWKDESGASLVEYSVLIGIITAAAITSIFAVGGWVSTKWSGLSTELAKH